MAPIKLQFAAGGKWQASASDDYLPITDSSTGQTIALAPCCTKEEVTAAIEAAAQAYQGWSSTPVHERAALMFSFRSLLEDHLDELSLSVSKEIGKTLDEARGDVIKAIEVVEMACGAPGLMQGESLMNVSRGFDTVMYRHPLGVFAGIVPFNFPAMIPFGWMIPLCITTGNTFVLKASSQTPMTAIRMLELLMEAGLPDGVVNLVTCRRDAVSPLLEHPAIKGVSYVGSTKVGRLIYAQASSNGKRVQVLGEAKNHGLVLNDANLENAAAVVINSTFGCAGQRCMALPALCVQQDIADEFVGLLADMAKQRRVGCAYDPDTELGPVVSAEHKQSIIDWIDRGVAEKAELIVDGRNVKVDGYGDGFYVGPTIFDHVIESMSIGSEEIFGGVTAIKRVRDLDHGLAIMNSSRYANGSCIFTESGYYAREFAYHTDAGMVGVNVGIPVPVSVFPFSGHKDSFLGDLHVMGRDGVEFYTEKKSVTSRWFGKSQRKQRVSTWEGTISRT